MFTYSRTVTSKLDKLDIPPPRKGSRQGGSDYDGDGSIPIEVHEDALPSEVSAEQRHDGVSTSY